MKKYSFLLLAAMGLLASCAKEVAVDSDTAQSKGKTVISVSMPADESLKTYLGDKDAQNKRPVYWSDGDDISCNGVASEALSDVEEGQSSASFTFEGLLYTPYKIAYPASIWTDATHVTLPAQQTYAEGNISDGQLPMAGYGAAINCIQLSHLCAIVKVSIKRASGEGADKDKIQVVYFKGKNDEQVSGTFAIDYAATSSLTPATATTASAKTVFINGKLATSTETALVYHLVVPARTYANGFDIIVRDENNHEMVKSKASSVTLAPGALYDLPELEFVPTTTHVDVEIANAGDLVDFAENYVSEYYDLGSSLVVNVTSDISFDAASSAAFNATGGIGDQAGSLYFNGSFNGNNHTISGLTATAPLFEAIGGGGTVKNLTLDNSCSFTFTHANDSEGMFGSVAGYHKGTIDHVAVAADIALDAVADVTYMTSLGGLVGRATTGTTENSEYSGLISTPAGFTGTGKLIIGGLVGRFSNNGGVSDSYFKGAITNAAQITSTDENNPYLIIGGVAGLVDGGASVTSCSTTADHADEASAYSDFSGKIVNKTSVAYHSALGGIVGELNNGTVSSCENAATIALTIYRNDDNCRFMKTGGIVGKNNADGSITGCTNNGSVQHRSNPKYQLLGGIAGYNEGTISDCTNNAVVNQMTSGQSVKAGRYVYLGGIIGENKADNKVSNVHNTANVEISSMEDNANSKEYIGGVIGFNKGIVVGGDTKDVTNSGQVYHSPAFTNQFAGYYVGGIAGLTTAAVKNAKNTGRPYFRWNSTSNGVSNVHIGGIAGKAEGAAGTIENCENTVDPGISNSAQVYLYLPGNASYSNNFVGGIVGLSEATNPVKDCTNGGEVRTAAGASTTPVTGIMMGGIIGKMTGSGEVNNADNSGRVRINFAVAEEGHSGNYLGGIAGYITNASTVTVTGCDNSGQVDISCGAGLVQDCIVSGVVGRMDAPGSIAGSRNNGGTIQMSITANSVGPKDLYAAGILGYTANNVTISGSSNSGAISGGNSTPVAGTAFYAGGIVAYLKGASKILNCSNTGSTATTHAGNTDTIGNTSLTGGIAGFVEGTSEAPIEIGGTTGCTVNTSADLSANRGWIGGVAAYAKYAQISNCTIESIIGGGCAARGAGGIVGKAEYCTISSSSYNGNQIKANQIQAANGEGGIAGYADNCTIDGCSCYATKFLNNNAQPFGGIVGKSNSNNTIQNCRYKSAVEGPTTGTAVTATIVGSGSYTDGGGNVADL